MIETNEKKSFPNFDGKRVPFKRGAVANPRGRPKKKESLTQILRDELEVKHETSEGKKITMKKMLVMRLLKLAVEGDLVALRYVFDRVEGMPRQALDLALEARPVIFPDGALPAIDIQIPEIAAPTSAEIIAEMNTVDVENTER